jgi:hypothetical protein
MPGDYRLTGGGGGGAQWTITFAPVRIGAGDHLTVDQIQRKDLPPGYVLGTATRVHGQPAYFGNLDASRYLAWHEGEVAVVLTSDVLSGAELLSVADGMVVAP